MTNIFSPGGSDRSGELSTRLFPTIKRSHRKASESQIGVVLVRCHRRVHFIDKRLNLGFGQVAGVNLIIRSGLQFTGGAGPKTGVQALAGHLETFGEKHLDDPAHRSGQVSLGAITEAIQHFEHLRLDTDRHYWLARCTHNKRVFFAQKDLLTRLTGCTLLTMSRGTGKHVRLGVKFTEQHAKAIRDAAKDREYPLTIEELIRKAVLTHLGITEGETDVPVKQPPNRLHAETAA